MRVLRNSLSIDSLLIVYYGQIHSHLNYGIILWGNHPSAHSLFVLQKRAVRLIYGASSRSHCRPLFILYGILTLPSMFVLVCRLYVKTNLDNLTICNSVHSYSTRYNCNIYVTKCKYSYAQKSFHNISLKLFNSLPLSIRNLPLLTLRRKVRIALKRNPLYDVQDFYNISSSI